MRSLQLPSRISISSPPGDATVRPSACSPRVASAPFLGELKERFDFVIVDSSPILPVADASIVAQQVDAVLFSIFRDVSSKTKVHAALQRLQSLGVQVLGAVVTGVHGGAVREQLLRFACLRFQAARVGGRLLGVELVMINMIRISAAVVLIVGAGLVNGAWTNRWGPSPALTALASRFESVPMVIGDWKVTAVRVSSRRAGHGRRGGQPFAGSTRTPAAGSPSRFYCSAVFPAKISTHTPDVCYSGAGFVLESSSPYDFRYGGDGERRAEFQTAVATRGERIPPSCGSSGAGTPPRAGPRPRSRAGHTRQCLPSASSTSSERLPERPSIPAPILATSSSTFFCRKSTGSCFLTRSDFDDETHSKWRGLLA